MGSRLCQATGFILTTLGKIIIIFRHVYGYVCIGMSSMNSLTCMSVYRWILLRHEVGTDTRNKIIANIVATDNE